MDTWEPALGTAPLLGIAAAAVAMILLMVSARRQPTP